MRHQRPAQMRAPQRAVVGVGARLQNHVYARPGEAAERGIIRRRLHPELLNHLRRRLKGDSPVPTHVGDAIEREFARPRPCPRHRDVRYRTARLGQPPVHWRIGRNRPRRKLHQVVDAPSRQRHLADHAVVHHLPQARGPGFEDGGFGGHRNAIGHRAQLQLDVEFDDVAHPQRQARARVLLESFELNAQDIGARQLIEKVVNPFLVSGRRGRGVRLRLLDLHFGTQDSGTLLVGNAAREPAIRVLRRSTEREQNRDEHKQRAR